MKNSRFKICVGVPLKVEELSCVIIKLSIIFKVLANVHTNQYAYNVMIFAAYAPVHTSSEHEQTSLRRQSGSN
jgi:hypothetical protein